MLGLMTRPAPDAATADVQAAVVAHAAIRSISHVQANIQALQNAWYLIEPDRRDQSFEATRGQLIGTIAYQADHLRGLMQDLAQGMPTEVTRALNSLEDQR